jgi:hypothetical protein
MTHAMLVGQVDNRDEQIQMLEDQLRDARSQVLALEAKLEHVRKRMSPLYELYQSLQAVFDKSGVIVPTGTGTDTITKWEFWKKRYPGRVAEVIDLLLIQREMNGSQLCSALKCDPRTLSAKVIYPLNKAGLINKNGGRYSLKEI